MTGDNIRGSAPWSGRAVGRGQEHMMGKAEKAGVYKDDQGNQFFYREGAPLPEGLELVEAADRNAGAPEKRDEGGDEGGDEPVVEVVHEEPAAPADAPPAPAPKGKGR
jgi:hypothetical protein